MFKPISLILQNYLYDLMAVKLLLPVKTINLLIKLVIFILLALAIYYQVFQYKDLDDVLQTFVASLHSQSIFLLGCVLILLFFNWGFETLKWKKLIDKMEVIPFFTAYKAILCGVTFAVFTPNRIGEYGGRIFYLQKADKIKAILVTLIGSLSQITVTITMGVLGLMYYLWVNELIDPKLLFIMGLIMALLIFLVLGVYFNVRFAYRIMRRIIFLKKVRKLFRIFLLYDNRELAVIFGLSLLRFGVFTAQYLLLLKVFGIDVPVVTGLNMIMLIFLVQSILPSITLIELGIRGPVAIYFLGQYAATELSILTASYSLWLINLIIPALIGGLLIARINFFKNTAYA